MLITFGGFSWSIVAGVFYHWMSLSGSDSSPVCSFCLVRMFNNGWLAFASGGSSGVVWYVMALLVQVRQCREFVELFLRHEAEAFPHPGHLLSYLLTVDVIIGPFAETVCIPVLRAWTVHYLKVVLVQSRNPPAYQGLIHRICFRP